MESITIELKIEFSEIKEVALTPDNKTKLMLNNGDLLILSGKTGRDIFKKLCRNEAGDHL